MHAKKSPHLFKHGLAAEVKLFFLALLCIVVLIVDSNWSVLEPVRRIAANLLYPWQRVALWPRDMATQIYNWSHAVSVVEKQGELTERQKIENARLMMESSQLAVENAQLRRLLAVKETVTVPSVAVQILYTPNNYQDQRIILTKGAKDGIEPGMPVIGEGGIVGQIRRVTANTSEAALITDDKTSIPALVKRNGLRTIVFGSGYSNQIEVRYLSLDVDIKEGDELVTSGIGGYYPAGLNIGTITKIDTSSTQGFINALAEPSAHPDRYRHFLVLLKTPDTEMEDKAKNYTIDDQLILGQ